MAASRERLVRAVPVTIAQVLTVHIVPTETQHTRAGAMDIASRVLILAMTLAGMYLSFIAGKASVVMKMFEACK